MTPLQPTLRSRTLAIAMVSALCLGGFESIALAQRGGFGGGGSGGGGPGGGRGGFGGRGMPTPEESFQRMDRNQNGLLDPDEIQQLPGFLKDMYARAGQIGRASCRERVCLAV